MRFWSPPFLWFYIYFCAGVALFYGVLALVSRPHPWRNWSILGSALILFTTYFQVQVSVAINDWYGPFYDLIQAALGKTARRSRSANSTLGIARFLSASRWSRSSSAC